MWSELVDSSSSSERYAVEGVVGRWGGWFCVLGWCGGCGVGRSAKLQ